MATKHPQKKAKSRTFNIDKSSSVTLAERIKPQVKSFDSVLSLVLGSLVVIVASLFIVKFFQNNQTNNLGDAEQAVSDSQENTKPSTSQEKTKDIQVGNLPGNYTVKAGDTLFTIAQTYYNDGYKYPKLAEANNLQNPDLIEVGQVLLIPKLDDQASTSTSDSPQEILGTGGAINQTIWGETITGDTYTVVPGDWLTKIAGRAYGDISMYTKILQANNITDPNNIEPGTVLKIPR